MFKAPIAYKGSAQFESVSVGSLCIANYFRPYRKKQFQGVIGFEIGQFLLKLGAAHSLTRSRVSQMLTFVIVDIFEPSYGFLK